ncbi:MAG: MerR family transcriptional regulator [Lachnospiraceae bacterium]|jgi:DNA-binding transcriptional MerR regulator|nr:MerR family transcriptional regulator [Lachnospiraceae bacterium]
MKTVKDVSRITKVSIRTLRYYDEIGLLKPTELTDAGYRLYDNRALERLQEIMFFRELEIPLEDIKNIMDHPDYDREQVLLTQKALLEQKRNRLNGIIELITDVLKGVNTMNFEAFSDEEVEKILDHTLQCMSKESLKEQIQKYGTIEKYREQLASGFSNGQAFADVFKWYGGKEKAMEAILQSTGDTENLNQERDENAKIYRQFMEVKESGNESAQRELVERLAKNYKKMFHLDNARNILLDLAKEYLNYPELAEITDNQFGVGCSEYVAHAIQKYYGV